MRCEVQISVNLLLMTHVALQMTKKDIQLDQRPLQSLLKVLRFEVYTSGIIKPSLMAAR